MNTQFDEARAGRITPAMKATAAAEKCHPGLVRSEIAKGRAVLPANPDHKNLRPAVVGRAFRTKVNANIGLSTEQSDCPRELRKLSIALEAGADYIMDLSVGKNVGALRRKMIAAFGAKITLTDGKLGTDGAIKKTRELVAGFPEKYYHTDQFSNDNNILAHYETTAVEIWEQMKGQIDYFVAAIGTSGTLMGVGKFLKQMKPSIRIVSAEPVKGHYIQGLKNMEEAIIPAIYDRKHLDDIIMVETEAAFDMARQIARKEGIFCGMSSGATMFASLEIAKKIKSGNIITIFPDRGEKYLSTSLFDQIS